jgi:pimeloyl-ACP methyl ester carboxylesterase
MAAQQRLLSLSTNSTHLVATRSGHMIQFTEPDVIVSAIERLLVRRVAMASGWR